jgi:uncharacterized damage-inducible protein DinB
VAFQFSFEDLLAYSDWDRAQWHNWFRDQGPDALAIGLGANVDGRVTTVGELVRHIFSAETRYVERSLGLPLSDTSTVPVNDVEALFAFGEQSRRALRQLLATFPENEWDAPRAMQLGTQVRTVTPRKMVVQTVTHELRHWAQVATFVRLAGRKSGMHDVIASPLFDAPASAQGDARS